MLKKFLMKVSSMPPKYTYQLSIIFDTHSNDLLQIRENVKAWLYECGEQTFVEGVLDNLDIDHEFVDPGRDFYEEYGGNASPITLYSYNLEHLQDIETKLMQAFVSKIKCIHARMETTVWLEGWKESFKPIKTEQFYLYPPWEKNLDHSKLIPIIIDPGMAFGTGQHATTQICLRAMETVCLSISDRKKRRFLDVGTGSGVLSIAAKKLQFGTVHACDIDPNAILASEQNALANEVSFKKWKGSLPSIQHLNDDEQGSYDVVVANILYVVLEKIIGDLAQEMKKGSHLILSGLLLEQRKEMLSKACPYGLVLVQEWEQLGWSGLHMEKK